MHAGRRPCEHRDRDWSDASTSQRTPGVDGLKLEEVMDRSPPGASEGSNPADTLIPDFQSPELRQKSLLV